MGMSLYEFMALFSLIAVGFAAGWCFKGVWKKEIDSILAERLAQEEGGGEEE